MNSEIQFDRRLTSDNALGCALCSAVFRFERAHAARSRPELIRFNIRMQSFSLRSEVTPCQRAYVSSRCSTYKGQRLSAVGMRRQKLRRSLALTVCLRRKGPGS